MKKFIVVLFVSFLCAGSLRASEIAGILEKAYAKPGVAESFKPGGDWYPYPAYSDRAAWDKLLLPEEKKAFIKKARKYLGYKWQHIPASTFLNFNITGDKQELRKIELKNREAFIALMMGELAEGKGNFLMDIADGLWFYGTSYHWHLSNQIYGQLPRYEMEKIGLGCARLGATIPIAWHFFHEEMDKMDPAIGLAVQAAVKRIIIDPALEGYGTDKFRWLGPVNNKRSNWNPWCNHGCLFAILLMEQDQDRINAAVKASVENVDKYLEAYPEDAACEEGAGYWGQSVGRFCDYLQMLRDASGGKFEVLPNDFISAMADYRSRTYVGIGPNGKSLKVNFADGNATGGNSPMSLYKVGTMFGSNELKDLAVYQCMILSKKQFEYPNVVSDEGYKQLENVRCYKEMCARIDKLNDRIKSGAEPEEILSELRADVPHQTWYPITQQAMLRTGDNWFIGAKAGNNGEVHGHNDVGSFILYVHNVPFLIDPGVGTYVKETFSSDRFTIWSMTADWHNCPAPNGVQEKEGAEHKASYSHLEKIKSDFVMSSEFAAAFPEEAACKSYIRTLKLTDSKRKSELEMTDEYELSERKAADDIHFVTPGKVNLVKPGQLTIENAGETLVIDYPSVMTPAVEKKVIDDDRIGHHWNGVLYAIRFTGAPDAPLKGSYVFHMATK